MRIETCYFRIEHFGVTVIEIDREEGTWQLKPATSKLIGMKGHLIGTSPSPGNRCTSVAGHLIVAPAREWVLLT